jgi:hypothetical protein
VLQFFTALASPNASTRPRPSPPIDTYVARTMDSSAYTLFFFLIIGIELTMKVNNLYSENLKPVKKEKQTLDG